MCRDSRHWHDLARLRLNSRQHERKDDMRRRTCKDCGKTKGLGCFPKTGGGKYYRRICKLCERKRVKAFNHSPNGQKLQKARTERRKTQTADKICKQCGESFKSKDPWVQHCSPKCRGITVGDMNRGRTNSPEHIAEIVRLRAMHPNTGRFETNFAAIDWSLSSPTGEVFIFRNLQHFVRQHRHLFSHAETEGCETGSCLAAHQLGRLAPWRKHPIPSWKEWTWEYDSNTNERTICKQ